MPDSEELAKALEATEDEVSSVDDADLDGTLIPLIRRKLGRDRQSMLATMVLQGMNRVIIDDGQIEASMDLAVDARSTAEQTTAERLDTRVTTSASGSFGMGVWGASASLSATVGYVKSDEQFSREDMSCWAASAAMLIGWRESIPVDPEEVAGGIGRWQDFKDGLHPTDVDELARTWELVMDARVQWTPDALRLTEAVQQSLGVARHAAV